MHEFLLPTFFNLQLYETNTSFRRNIGKYTIGLNSYSNFIALNCLSGLVAKVVYPGMGLLPLQQEEYEEADNG
jgi:hypothetical protein